MKQTITNKKTTKHGYNMLGSTKKLKSNINQMKKYVFFTIIFYFIIIGLHAQKPMVQDTILPYNNVRYFYVENKIYRIQPNRQDYKYLRDSIVIKSNITYFPFSSYYYNSEKNQLFIEGQSLIVLDFNNDEITIKPHPERVYRYMLYKGMAYYSARYPGELFVKNLSTGTIDTFNLNEKLNTIEQDILEIIKLNDDNFLVNMGYEEGGATFSKGLYIFNEPDFIFEKIEPEAELKTIFGEHGAWVEYYSLCNNYAFFRNGIIDANYNYFSGILPKHISINGFVIRDNEIKKLLVVTVVERPDRFGRNPSVLIPFNPCPFLEKAMYEIYNNVLLASSDVDRFNRFELRLIRNMVFAKHNYKFNDEFLGAYFNLYSFYRYTRVERLTDINHLLTDADKANLALIRAAEARAKE